MPNNLPKMLNRCMKNPIIKKIIGYILNGLLISLPLVITFYVVYRLFTWLDGLIPGEREYPGLGILLLLVLLFLLGFIGTKVINEPLKRLFMRFLDRVPLIKTIYKSITDLLGAFVGSKKRFNQPVLVKVSKEMDLEMIGFVTDEDLSELGDSKELQGKVAVYFPMSYSFAGHMMIVPKNNVTPVDRNAVDVMKYIVSGGVVELDHEDHATS